MGAGGEDDRDDKPREGLVYSVKDVGTEVLGRVSVQRIATPKGGVPRSKSASAAKRPAPIRESRTGLRTPSEAARAELPTDAPPAPAAPAAAPTKKRGAIRTDHVRASVEAPRTASEPPPAPLPLTLYERALPALKALRACGPGDEGPPIQALLKLGAPILELVETDFPGLLWFHRHLAHRKLPQGRAIGPLGALLVSFGVEAVPSVERLLDSGSSDARYYAALVASDLLVELDDASARRLVAALAEKLFDSDSGVRDVSLHGLLAAGEHDALEEVRERLRTYAVDLGAPLGTRIVALRALGVLRRGEVVPDVIPLLDDREEQIRDNAHRVLRLLSGVDLGTSLWRWRRWWKKHAGTPRSEWLLEGLGSSDGALRVLAQKELARLTGHDEPSDPEASRAERKRIREVYGKLLKR